MGRATLRRLRSKFRFPPPTTKNAGQGEATHRITLGPAFNLILG